MDYINKDIDNVRICTPLFIYIR